MIVMLSSYTEIDTTQAMAAVDPPLTCAWVTIATRSALFRAPVHLHADLTERTLDDIRDFQRALGPCHTVLSCYAYPYTSSTRSDDDIILLLAPAPRTDLDARILAW